MSENSTAQLFSIVRQVKIEAVKPMYHGLTDDEVREKIESLLSGYGFAGVRVTVESEA